MSTAIETKPNGVGSVTNNGKQGIATSEPSPSSSKKYTIEIVWRNIILITGLHFAAIWGLYLYFFQAHPYTIFFTNILTLFLAMGITCGAHRLWSHRSYEANFPLRVFLMILNCGMLQNDIYEWCRDHRVHHKFSETDADPHNSNRGFFFAHMGWLMCKKHDDVITKGATVDMSDLERDSVVRFQRQFYKPLAMFFTFYLPAFIPYYFWGENIYTSFFLTTLRYTFSLHGTWCVNSFAHFTGMKLYDQTINPVESRLVQISSVGEGYHNYHHTFPYDYSASEYSWKHNLNVSTMFIDFFHYIGWAKNLKKVDPKIIESRMKRTGDEKLYREHAEAKKEFNGDTLKAIFGFLVLLPIGILVLRKLVFFIF